MFLTYNQEQFVYWVKERESIRLKKEQNLPKPWSENPIMQNTYFTNIDREDDKVTKWIRENWTYPYDKDGNDSIRYYEMAMAAARIFNLPSTLEVISQPVEDSWFENTEQILKGMKSKKQKIWGAAYMTTTHGLKMDKIEYYLTNLREIAKFPKFTNGCKTLQDAHEKLIKFDGISHFMSAQIIADLKNTTGHQLSKAPDWEIFSAPGPGSLRGLTWFFEEKVTGRNYDRKISEAYALAELEFDTEIINKLCFQNFQNCMCEFDKFMRIANNTGRSKRKYNGVK